MQLSGGQRQRVLIVKSLLWSPKFLIMDEPVSSLDPYVQLEIINIIKKLKSFNNNEDRPKIDFKDYGIGAQILHDLGISNINLLSNSEQINRVGLSGYGLSIKKHTSY